MLSISKPLSPERAAWYFKRDDYYLAQEGTWHGTLSGRLKLSGSIKRNDFLNLLNGFDPDGNKLVASAGAKDVADEIGAIKKHGHRSGIDLTFSAPKSVSILSYHDPRVNEAFRSALDTTLDYIEKEFAYTRFKDKRGVTRAVKTDNLLWAKFEHDTSRELDPQLHCHCVLMNMTQDEKGQYKTIRNDPYFNNKMFIGQYFRNALAMEVRKIGYTVDISDRKKGFFEVRGVGEPIIKAFSERSAQVRSRMKELRELDFKTLYKTSPNQIVEWAKERKRDFSTSPDFDRIVQAEVKALSKSTQKVYASFNDAELAAIATTDSRKPKKDISKEVVVSRIESICAAHHTSLKEIHKKALSQKEPPRGKEPSSREILLSAVEGLTEGQATFSKHHLIAEAMKMGIGTRTYHDFEKAFNRLLKENEISLIGSIGTQSGDRVVFSSKEMIHVEATVMEMCKATKNTSDINVDRAATDLFIDRTAKNLKMESALQIGEKDPEKAEVKFKKMLSEIPEQSIRKKLASIREKALKAKSDPSQPRVAAEDYPDFHPYFEKFGYGLTPGQKDAIRLITSTKDRFSVIQGDAGTGKSFSMLYARQLLEQNGFLVRGLAPTGKAATGLGNSAQIVSERCGTIDSFLLQHKNADDSKKRTLFVKNKEVWIVDEAGMCGSRKILDLMKMADEAGAKVVFVGDRKQFASIEAGRMFSELQDKAGVDMVVMPDVMRQKTQQTRDIVKAISLKEFDFAFNVMQGFKEVGESFAKNLNENYSIGNVIRFSNDYEDIPAEVSCKVLSINHQSLEVEYFDEEIKSYQRKFLDCRNIDPEAFKVFDSPMNQYPLSRFRVKEFIEVQIPEQGLPPCRAKIVSITDSRLRLEYVDPSDNSIKRIDFDPVKNPTNIKHFSSEGNEKLSQASESYVDMITVETDKPKCLSMVAQDYLDSVSARKDTLLITGTNKDKDALNDLIRPELLKQGLVKGSQEFEVFRTKSLAGTSAMAVDSYEPGQVIVTNNKCGSVSRGTQAEIQSVDINKNALTVRFWDKEKAKYITGEIDVRKEAKKFSTYDRIKREFGVGDRIIFLKNDKKVVGVNNGEIGKITAIDKDGNARAVLVDSDSKKEVSFNVRNKGPNAYNYVDHAYAITDYKSQGATTQRLLWHAPTDTGPLSSNSFYVAITRCKEEVAVYTNDSDELREKVKNEQQKESTLDYEVRNASKKSLLGKFSWPEIAATKDRAIEKLQKIIESIKPPKTIKNREVDNIYIIGS